jgi:phenylacetate-CoA ligase
MTEVGPVTYQCPATPGILHVLESAYFPEVLDCQSHLPVAAGHSGELVLTTLDRVGSPLLRYRTGDLVRPLPRNSCSCGSNELALAGGILGRSDDMVIIRGVNVYPALIEGVVRADPDVSEFRVQLDTRQSMAEVALEIEPAAQCLQPEAVQRRLGEALQNALHLRVPVRILPPGSLPRFEMKANRWVRSDRQ